MKLVKPLWNNSAVIGAVQRATEVVRAHSKLDKVTEDRIEGLVSGYKRQRADGNPETEIDLVSPFLVDPEYGADDVNTHRMPYSPLASSSKHTMIDDDDGNEANTPNGNFPNTKKRKTELLSTPHKPILTQRTFEMALPRVIPGLKSLREDIAVKFPEVEKEIRFHEQEQGKLSSLGKTLRNWLRGVLVSSSTETLAESLTKSLEGECLTDREKKLHVIFEMTLREFHAMIRYSAGHTLPRHNSERKFLIERVVTPFKLVEYVFGSVITYWIEKEIMSTKAAEFVDDPTSELTRKKADALAVDHEHNADVMILESSGGPLQQDREHTLGDSSKLTDCSVAVLLACLRKYLSASMETAKKLRTFSIQVIEDRITLLETSLHKPRVCKVVEVRSAVFPFGLASIGEYMRVFELVSCYVDGLINRQEVMRELANEASGVKELTSESWKERWNNEQTISS